MRLRLSVLMLLASAGAFGADTQIQLTVKNEAGLPEARVKAMANDYALWAAKVYAYHRVKTPRPVVLRLSRETPVALYRDGEVLMPPDEDDDEMLESWIHELAHHATGPESSFFFKEGIATWTLELLFQRTGRTPKGWPNYGHRADDWVALFLERGKMPKIQEALAWPRFLGDTPENDFRSWQIYLAGGSFCGWYIDRYGYARFREAFAKQSPGEESAAVEKAWLDSIRAQKLNPFDPAQALPDSPRYRDFAARLSAS